MDISAYQHMNIRMSTRGKRPLRNLTPSDKVRAIQRIHNGETKASVSRDIGVPESTLRGWCKNEQKLRFMCRQMGADHAGAAAAAAARIENLPSEKRAKYDTSGMSGAGGVGSFPNIPNFENIAFNRLPLNPMDFGGNNGALLSKFCMNNFEKQKNIFPLNKNGINPLMATRANAATTDCTQLPFLQNPHLMALLNSNLWSNVGVENVSNNNNNNNSNLNNNNNTNNNNPKKTNEFANGGTALLAAEKNTTAQPALSVKNWAKDFAEQCDDNELNRNDTNNNDVKPSAPTAGTTPTTDTGVFPLLFPGGMPAIPTIGNEQDRNNTALMEWCKMFNASINFLALAAAAASLQHQQQPAAALNADFSDSNSDSTATTTARNADNLLYKQLTQAAEKAKKSMHLYNDLSNDCAYESEPEDLSVRSTTSKLSSPAYSRSHSPAKSNTSRSSLNSDNE